MGLKLIEANRMMAWTCLGASVLAAIFELWAPSLVCAIAAAVNFAIVCGRKRWP